jgi:hypothetical protein
MMKLCSKISKRQEPGEEIRYGWYKKLLQTTTNMVSLIEVYLVAWRGSPSIGFFTFGCQVDIKYMQLAGTWY